jgi:hypothetical protein
MAESITVGYRQLGPGYYHKFVVYTDSSGNQWATSGWAGKDSSVKFSDFSQSGSSGSGSSGSDFGSIITTGGTSDPRRYDSFYPDHPKNPDGTDKYPGKDIKWEPVKTGDNLSGDWKKVTDAMDGIAGEKHQYRPLDQNSNTAADEALRRAIHAQCVGGSVDGQHQGVTFFDDTFLIPVIKSLMEPSSDLRTARCSGREQEPQSSSQTSCPPLIWSVGKMQTAVFAWPLA